jgi:hypothetical protein
MRARAASAHRLLAAVLTLGTALPSGAAASDGVALHEPWKPGKLDVNLHDSDDLERINFMWWSPVVKAGVGVQDVAGVETVYGGGFVRAVMGSRKLELIAGGEVLDRDDVEDAELQAELRVPYGFGFGGGVVNAENDAVDVTFGKTVHRGQLGNWHTILELQLQEVGTESSPGGYVALYEDRFMAVYGDDGEQRRATLAFMAPKSEGSPWRPVLEGIWVDEDIGDRRGLKVVFVNGTLGFRDGFLSHPARLGRAMGPTGLEFANPLGFLAAAGPWNRRLDTWELGGLGDVRLFRVERPNGVTSEVWEALVYPLQIAGRKGPLDGVFLGATYRTLTNTDDDPGLLAGWFGPVSFLRVGLALDYGFQSDDARATLGVIDPF